MQNTETARSFHNPIGKTTRRITPSGSRACRCCLLPTQHNTGYVEYFSKCLYYAYLYPPFSPGVCHADPHPLSRPRRAASYCSEKFSALPNHFSLGGVIFYMPRKIFPYCENRFTITANNMKSQEKMKIYVDIAYNDKGRRIGSGHPRAKFTDADVEHVLMLRTTGMTTREIADKMEMSESTVRSYIRGVRRSQPPMAWKRKEIVCGK